MLFIFFVVYRWCFRRPCSRACLHELKANVKLLFSTRCTGRGFQLPTVLYTDTYYEDRVLMVEIFRAMRDGGHYFSVDYGVPTSSDSAVFERPPKKCGKSATFTQASRVTNFVRAGVDKLRQEARGSGRV